MRYTKTDKGYIGAVFVGGGGCWYRADTLDAALTGCVKQFKRDWGGMFKPKDTLCVNLYRVPDEVDEVVIGYDGVWYGENAGTAAEHLFAVDAQYY